MGERMVRIERFVHDARLVRGDRRNAGEHELRTVRALRHLVDAPPEATEGQRLCVFF